MATRRRRSRRRWSVSRLHRRYLQHRASIVRAVIGAAVLAAFWWLWPGPDRIPVDRRGPGEQALAEQSWAGANGLVSAAQAGIALSAKGQLLGAAGVGRDRLEGRLHQVALTVPDPPSLAARHVSTAIPEENLIEPATGSSEEIEAAALAPEHPPSEFDSAPPMATLRGAPPSPAPPRPAVPGSEPAASEAGPLPDTASDVGAAEPVPLDAGEASSTKLPGIVRMGHAAAPARGPDASATQGQEAVVAQLGALGRRLPEIATGRTPTWLQNAVAVAIDDRPAIALVIDDLGVNRKGTAAAIGLQGPLTLAFLPYAAHLQEQTRAARAAGHELILHMPMEPAGDENPGPNALLASLEPADLVARVQSQLSSFQGFVGVNNHMGSRLTADRDLMSLVLGELRRQGLLFLDSRTTPRSVAAREARRLDVPFAERDVFIDNEIKLDAVLRQLGQVEKIARRKGYAVAIGHPHDVTIAALRRWLPTLEDKGFALVPISAIVARRACADDAPALHDACSRYTAIASVQP